MFIPATLYLALTIGVCPMVNKARASGLSDDQIETIARSRHVPEFVIRWAKVHCKLS